MVIKVCGMRDVENIRGVEALGVDMMGFIFWPKSKRYVSRKPGYLPNYVKRVGVFVDEDLEQVKRIADDFALDFIQLHGSESPDFIRQLIAAVAPYGCRGGAKGGVGIIKAFNIATAEDLEAIKPYEGLVDYFLFDTKGKSVGGNGEKFDWTVLTSYEGETPYLLSGGIGPDDAEMLHAQYPVLRSKCIGIDLNSRFELAPALKDVTALARFLNEIK